MQSYKERQRIREEILHAVCAAAENRNSLSEWIDDPDCNEKSLAWVIHERNAYHDAINRVRARFGWGPAPRSEILKAERQAVGHVDYGHKLSIYGADLCSSENAVLRGPF